MREVYEALVARHSGTENAAFAAQQMASQQPLPSRVEIDAAPLIPPGVSFMSLFATEAQSSVSAPVQAPDVVPGRALFSGFYSEE